MQILQSLLEPHNAIVLLYFMLWGCVLRWATIVLRYILSDWTGLPIVVPVWWRDVLFDAAFFSIVTLITSKFAILSDALIVGAIAFCFVFCGGAIGQDLHDRFIHK